MDDDRDREGSASRRPRVVDKRVSARAPEPIASPTEAGEPAAEEPPKTPPEPPPVAEPTPSPPPETEAAGLWTPEQEAEAQRVVEEIARVPSRDWVADAAVRLAQVAGVKLDRGDLADARVAIDAFAGLVERSGALLAEAEAPLRQTLAQLQMAYAQAVTRPAGPAP